MDFKNTPMQRPDDSVRAPLAKEETTSQLRDKTFEKQGKIKSRTRFQNGQQPERTGRHSPESIIIALDPDQVLTNIKKI